MAYSRILFDLDGTLTESGPGITHAVQYALQKMGIVEPDRSQLECFVGPPLNVMLRQRYGMNEEESGRTIRFFREAYNGGMIFENRVYPGIRELLEELHDRRIRLAIASSKPAPMVQKVLEHFDLRQYFDVMIGAAASEEEDNQSGTDHKLQMVRQALEALGIPAAQDSGQQEGTPGCACCRGKAGQEQGQGHADCAMVGDRSFDIRGALSNHVTAIGVTYGYGSRSELEAAGADYIAESVQELRTLLLA